MQALKWEYNSEVLPKTAEFMRVESLSRLGRTHSIEMPSGWYHVILRKLDINVKAFAFIDG